MRRGKVYRAWACTYTLLPLVQNLQMGSRASSDQRRRVAVCRWTSKLTMYDGLPSRHTKGTSASGTFRSRWSEHQSCPVRTSKSLLDGVCPSNSQSIVSVHIRWHPDKFMQVWGSKIAPNDKSTILDQVKATFQAINDARSSEQI